MLEVNLEETINLNLKKDRQAHIEKLESMRLDENAKQVSEFEVAINWANPMYNKAIDDMISYLKSLENNI